MASRRPRFRKDFEGKLTPHFRTPFGGFTRKEFRLQRRISHKRLSLLRMRRWGKTPVKFTKHASQLDVLRARVKRYMAHGKGPTARQILGPGHAMTKYHALLRRQQQKSEQNAVLAMGRTTAGGKSRTSLIPASAAGLSLLHKGVFQGIDLGLRIGQVHENLTQAALLKWEQIMGDFSMETVKDFVAAVFVGTIDRTPSLTGQARANWHMSIGGPSYKVFLGIPPGGASRHLSGGLAHLIPKASGQRLTGNSFGPQWQWADNKIPGITMIQLTKDLKASLWINNNIEYISDLEDGTRSAQVPNGMLKPAIIEASALFGGYVDAMDNAISIEDMSLNARMRHGF